VVQNLQTSQNILANNNHICVPSFAQAVNSVIVSSSCTGGLRVVQGKECLLTSLVGILLVAASYLVLLIAT